MIAVRTAWALSKRRAVWGVAAFAALAVGLSSSIMQELAHSQREAYDAQVAFVQQAGPDPSPDSRAVEAFGRQTNALGSRARTLQSVGGVVRWAQVWLVTLVGLMAVLIAIAVVTAADLEQRRLLVAWHPARSSGRPLLVTVLAAFFAALLVAAGAVAGAGLAGVAGAATWPLGQEPAQVVVASLGAVASGAPSAGWIVGWLGAVSFMIAMAWFTRRTLVAVLGASATIGVAALLTDTLPDWAPLTDLPATAGMWFQHRGEVGLAWLWPVTIAEDGGPSLDWKALSTADPGTSSLIGALLLLAAVAVCLPFGLRRTPE
jgi:hypothetical protein